MSSSAESMVMVVWRGARRYHSRTPNEKHTPESSPAFRVRWLAWLLLVLALAAPWTRIPTDNADGAGMIAHLHALFESGELLYDDEYQALGMSPLFAFVTEPGVVSNHWPIGASFAQAPGWLLGRLAGVLLVGEGVSARAAEWTIPLLGLRAWAIVVMIALVLGVHAWLRARTSSGVAALAGVALLLGTPLLYYASEAPMRPHLWGAALVAIVIARWWDAVDRATRDVASARARGPWPAIELAAWIGLATAIRPQLAMLVVLVAHERWLVGAGLDRRARVSLWVKHGLLAALAWLPWAALNLRMQRWMYGELGDYAGEVSLHVRAFLVSTHHGALVWCPVLVLGVLGLAIGLARKRPGAGVLLILLAAQIWLDAGTREIEPFTVLGTRTWTGGAGFGPRKLLDVAPIFMPALIWLHEWLVELPEAERRKWRTRLTIATIASLIPTTLLHLAAWLDPHVTSEVMDGERLLIAMGLAFDPAVWSAAFDQRALPLRVPLVVAGVVGLPLALGCVAALRPARVDRAARVDRPARAAAIVVGLGVLAQVWLAIVIVRSEALLVEQPERMARARAAMNPIHVTMVRLIPQHHAILRERLGPEAAD
ncbi:hypothetical protein ACNOYE_37860 [Nannocystaceae bacterium ST9]